VAAFRATLEELEEATLLLHVIDITHPDAEEQAETVEDTLEALGIADRPKLVVLNKADLVQGEDGRKVGGPQDLRNFQLPPWARGGILVSAAKEWALEELRRRIEVELADIAELGQSSARSNP
jgi:GTP-binding protein HflX